MNDSYDKLSFREGWQPTGRSADVTLHFQRYANDFRLRPDALYYFKPVETFNVPGMSDDDKFEGIDSTSSTRSAASRRHHNGVIARIRRHLCRNTRCAAPVPSFHAGRKPRVTSAERSNVWSSFRSRPALALVIWRGAGPGRIRPK